MNRYHVLTLFPEMIQNGLGTSITGRAIEKGAIGLEAVNIRDYAGNRYGKVDDYPYGGGAGMVMQAEPVYQAWKAVTEQIGRRARTIYVTPQGAVFTQAMAQELAKEEDLIFLCGHYEGVDERVLEEIVTDYVSIGDYVLTGGELPAMVMIDAISRMVPGVLSNETSAESESFQDGLLEYPQYSRPEEWHGRRVPEVLLSGHHARIEKWRLEQSVSRTRERRPDLYEAYQKEQESRFEIRCVNEGVRYRAKEGQTILEAEIAAGITPDAPCGGQGTCGKCRVEVNGKSILACQTKVEPGMRIDTGKKKRTRAQILASGRRREVPLAPGKLPREVEHPLLAAVDVGSTTVAAYLMDGLTGEQLAVKSRMNPQRQYGADVVTRGSYAMEKGASALSSCIREAVDGLLFEAAQSCGRKAEEIVRIAMVGNSCMHHLFLELPVDTLVMAPYEPKGKEALTLPALECGLVSCPHAEVLWLANIGGFVGADTVGCILASGISEEAEMTLLVDIGTNGEMVLGNRDGLLACSTAAGPAFEGAKITCGMRGSEGAIDRVWVEKDRLSYHVIGGGEARGICGSGLLDAAACLLRLGRIDEGGRMEEPWYFTENVYLNQKDIRELQLAKAAICAGIRLLCAQRGITPEQIGKVWLAGAFGNYMNPSSACAIGMFPEELNGRICSIGNAAGEGARMAALNQEAYEESSRLAADTEFVELAHKEEFQEIFVKELGFPERT